MVRNKSELIETIKTFIGENDSDEAIAILEDVSDTFTDLEGRINDKEDWKTKYEENNKAWRKKYKERFTAPLPEKESEDPETPEENPEEENELTFDNLFKNE